MRLEINGQEAEVASPADLRPYWDAVRRHQFSEVWLRVADEGPALAMLVNQPSAWLMYLGQDEDIGFSSRNPEYAGPPDAHLDFVLGNAQRDYYPVAWVLPLQQALAACEYFLRTQGERSPDVVWHDDAVEDKP
ncbi:MAG TPA: Imm1 family immunity protein [Ktedonobacterales bacterium]